MVTQAEFRQLVIESGQLSIVKFKTDWSGSCQIIAPVYEELADAYKGKAVFYTVDVEAEKGLHDEYGVMELPTILFFSDGEIIDHIRGLVSKSTMISKIENALTQK